MFRFKKIPNLPKFNKIHCFLAKKTLYVKQEIANHANVKNNK